MEVRSRIASTLAPAAGAPRDGSTTLLRAAVIGLGVGEQHLSAYARHPACEVALVCDIAEGKRREAARRYPGLKIVADPQASLSGKL